MDIGQAGKFDLILLLEVSKKAGDLDKLLIMCKEMLSNEDGKIVIMARPKSPSPPLPECCRPIWRELSYTRDEILAAINNAELQSTCVSSSVPVSIGKFDWEAILYTGNITVVKMCPKCTEQEIAKFCKSQSPQVAFEEKLNVFLIRLKS
ncbi:unnamed protein product [Thelazia callipaeda]|uniref:CUB domain-containing protein n=1 Tax=Thelazia callipaeda TaxID=103827 RepID=A0A0N5CQV1_THECL|nr:unnamed protein product [Thelazia callipaeda]